MTIDSCFCGLKKSHTIAEAPQYTLATRPLKMKYLWYTSHITTCYDIRGDGSHKAEDLVHSSYNHVLLNITFISYVNDFLL